MQKKLYTVEELMLTDSFVDFCLSDHPAKREFWENEIDANAQQHMVFAEARYLIGVLHGKLSGQEIGQEVEKVKRSILAKQQRSRNQHPLLAGGQDELYSRQPRSRKKFLLLALCTGTFVVFCVYFFNRYRLPSPIAAAPSEKSYTTRIGERSTIALPDGSKVILNSNSHITLDAGFNESNRSLSLTGEAFFQVAKDPSRPFIVNSDPFSVTAIGTAFYVHANRGENYRVELLEGKVKLNSNAIAAGTPTMLLPGENASWQNSKSSFEKNQTDTIAMQKWITGKLSFQEVPVQDVLEMLEKWYAISITVKNKNWGATKKLTGYYDNVPLEDVLQVICFSLSCKYRYINDQVIIE